MALAGAPSQQHQAAAQSLSAHLASSAELGSLALPVAPSLPESVPASAASSAQSSAKVEPQSSTQVASSGVEEQASKKSSGKRITKRMAGTRDHDTTEHMAPSLTAISKRQRADSRE